MKPLLSPPKQVLFEERTLNIQHSASLPTDVYKVLKLRTHSAGVMTVVPRGQCYELTTLLLNGWGFVTAVDGRALWQESPSITCSLDS